MSVTDNNTLNKVYYACTHFNFKDKTFCIQLILTSEAIKKFLLKSQERIYKKNNYTNDKIQMS